MHEVLVNRLGGLNLPRKSVVRLTDRPDMTLDVYRGRKTIKQLSASNFSNRFNARKNLRNLTLIPIVRCSVFQIPSTDLPTQMIACFHPEQPLST